MGVTGSNVPLVSRWVAELGQNPTVQGMEKGWWPVYGLCPECHRVAHDA